MPEEQTGRIGIAVAVEHTDWTQYAGQASVVKRRGERRRRRLRAGTALATTAAVIGVAVVASGLGKRAVAQQGASPTSTSSVSDYPTFPAKPPTKPLLVANPGRVLQSGVIGAGAVSGHQWQISYRVIPSASAANDQPQVSKVDVSLDGKTVSVGGSQGAVLSVQGYMALNQEFEAAGSLNPMVVGYGTPSPGVTSVDLRWTNGAVVQVPIRTATGTRFASFAWNPANPPEALEQVSANGVQKITITRSGDQSWMPDLRPDGKPPSPVPGSSPSVHTPTGTPNLSQTPQVQRISAGLLGEGTVSGRQWQLAYDIIPSGSAENDSNEVFCTQGNVGAATTQNGCTSSKPFTARFGSFFSAGQDPLPLVVSFGAGEPRTTSMGLEWPDGTKVVNAMQYVEGNPMAAVAFDPAKPPSYILEFGSYGEYRIPLMHTTRFTWTFHGPN